MTNENSALNLAEIKSGLTRLKSKPIQMNIDLIGRCNINPPCVFCGGHSKGHGYDPIDYDSLEPHISFMSQCSRIADCSFGEPLMHPAFLQIVKETLKRGQGFTFSTNGLLLKPHISDELIRSGSNIGFSVSLNASSPETYFKLTGKNLAVVLENIRYFVRKYLDTYNNIPPLALSFIAMRVNRHEVADFIRLAHELKIASINFRHLFTDPGAKVRDDFGYDFHYQSEILNEDEYLELEDTAQKIAQEFGITPMFHWRPARSAIGQLAEPGSSAACLFPWKFLFFQNSTRNIYICCYSDCAVMTLAERQSLDEAWNCPDIVAIRDDFIKGKIPRYCIEHGRYCPLVTSRLAKGEDSCQKAANSKFRVLADVCYKFFNKFLNQ